MFLASLLFKFMNTTASNLNIEGDDSCSPMFEINISLEYKEKFKSWTTDNDFESNSFKEFQRLFRDELSIFIKKNMNFFLDKNRNNEKISAIIYQSVNSLFKNKSVLDKEDVKGLMNDFSKYEEKNKYVFEWASLVCRKFDDFKFLFINSKPNKFFLNKEHFQSEIGLKISDFIFSCVPEELCKYLFKHFIVKKDLIKSLFKKRQLFEINIADKAKIKKISRLIESFRNSKKSFLGNIYVLLEKLPVDFLEIHVTFLKTIQTLNIEIKRKYAREMVYFDAKNKEIDKLSQFAKDILKKIYDDQTEFLQEILINEMKSLVEMFEKLKNENIPNYTMSNLCLDYDKKILNWKDSLYLIIENLNIIILQYLEPIFLCINIKNISFLEMLNQCVCIDKLADYSKILCECGAFKDINVKLNLERENLLLHEIYIAELYKKIVKCKIKFYPLYFYNQAIEIVAKLDPKDPSLLHKKFLAKSILESLDVYCQYIKKSLKK